MAHIIQKVGPREMVSEMQLLNGKRISNVSLIKVYVVWKSIDYKNREASESATFTAC